MVYPDLMDQELANNLMLAEKVQRGKMTLIEMKAVKAQLHSQIVTEFQRRQLAKMAATASPRPAAPAPNVTGFVDRPAPVVQAKPAAPLSDGAVRDDAGNVVQLTLGPREFATRGREELRRHSGGAHDSGAHQICGISQQIGPHAVDHLGIVARRRLPVQSRRRIPRAVVAIEQPSIVRHIRQKDPDRLAKRARKMRNAGIDRNHEIKLLDQRRGIGKTFKLARRIQDVTVLTERTARSLSRAFFCRLTNCAAVSNSGFNGFQRQRAVAIIGMVGIAGPDDSDPRPFHRTEERLPLPGIFGDRNIRHAATGMVSIVVSNASGRLGERTLQVVVGQWLALDHALRDAGDTGQETL